MIDIFYNDDLFSIDISKITNVNYLSNKPRAFIIYILLMRFQPKINSV